MTSSLGWLAPLSALLLAGCPDDPGGGTGAADGGVFVDGAIDPHAPTAPEIPWVDPTTGEATLAPALPDLLPCPDGWREVDGACDPWPEGGPIACPDGQAHFPGEPGCAPVGAPCPAGDFAEGLADDGTVRFVRAGAAGGDGSRALPFGAVGDALAGASPGQTIAIARGRYDEALTLPDGVTLRGACAEATVLTTTTAAFATIYVAVPGVGIRDLSIRDTVTPAIAVDLGGEARVDGVIIQHALGIGLIASEAGRLEADTIVVRDTQPRTSDGRFGRGANVQMGGRMILSRAVFDDNREATVASLMPGSRLALHRAVIRGTGPNPGSASAWGLWVDGGGSADVAEVVLEANVGEAIRVSEAGAELQISDAVIVDTQEGARVVSGALGVIGGAAVTASRLRLERNAIVAIAVQGAGSDVAVSDALIRDTRPGAAGTYGRAIEAAEGAHVTVRRALSERNADSPLFLFEATAAVEDMTLRDSAVPAGEFSASVGVGSGSSLEATRLLVERSDVASMVFQGGIASLSDVLVRDTIGHDSGVAISGVALQLTDGAVVEAQRLFFEASPMVSIAIKDEGTDLSLTDAIVRRTLAQVGSGDFGRAVVAQERARLALARVVVEDSRQSGLEARAATMLLEDVRVSDVRGEDSTGEHGRGLDMHDGATVEALRVTIERSRETGVLAFDSSVATLRGLRVVDTRSQACALDRCPDRPFGTALGAFGTARAEVEDFRIAGADLCGVHLAGSPAVDLVRGEVRSAAIGACVQAPGYDLARLSDEVVYIDNGVNLQATSLPVPEPSPGFGTGP